MIPRAAALAAVATLPDGLSNHRRRLAKLINEIPEEEMMTQSTKDHPAILEERAGYEATIASLQRKLAEMREAISEMHDLASSHAARAEAAEAALATANDMYEAASRVSAWFCTEARHLEGHRINALRAAMQAYEKHMQLNHHENLPRPHPPTGEAP